MYILITMLLFGCGGSDSDKSAEDGEISCKDACQRYHEEPRDKEVKFIKQFYDKSGKPAYDDCFSSAINDGEDPIEHGCEKRAVESCASACEKHKSETKKKVGK